MRLFLPRKLSKSNFPSNFDINTKEKCASGTERHNVNIFNINGSFLNHVEPYSSFLQQNRSTPIAATAFHPHLMMLACSSLSNTHINIFTCQQ
jgi:regulator-associated protein of mTOR